MSKKPQTTLRSFLAPVVLGALLVLGCGMVASPPIGSRASAVALADECGAPVIYAIDTVATDTVVPFAECKATVSDSTWVVFGYVHDAATKVVVNDPGLNQLLPEQAGVRPPVGFEPQSTGYFSAPYVPGMHWDFGRVSVNVDQLNLRSCPTETLENYSYATVGTTRVDLRVPTDIDRWSPTIVDTDVDTNRLAAGAMPGSHAVSDSGQLSYRIPIEAPAGRNSVAPDVALAYHSGGGNGLVGVGWSIGGLSSIARCKTTIATDGNAGPVEYLDDGAYCLDGERLLPVSPPAGAPIGAREFRTEHDTFARVIVDGLDATGPTSWTVFAKDGRIIRYGLDSQNTHSIVEGSRSIPSSEVVSGAFGDHVVDSLDQSQRVRLSWAVTEVSDRVGNRMTYSYLLDDPCFISTSGDCAVERRPNEIRWTYGVNHPSANRAIRFSYDLRPDPEESYVAGLKTRLRYRLSAIEVRGPYPTVEGTVRTYRLGYNTAPMTGRSRLISVQECDHASACLPPTTFEWEDGDSNFTAIAAAPPTAAGVPQDAAWFMPFFHFTREGTNPVLRKPIPSDRWWSLTTLDINGDGKDDILYRVPSKTFDHWVMYDDYYRELSLTPGEPVKTPDDFTLKWVARLATSSGFSDPISVGLPDQLIGDYTATPRPMDFDGDGRMDIALPVNWSDCTALQKGPEGESEWQWYFFRRWKFYRSTGTGFVALPEPAGFPVDPVPPTSLDPANANNLEGAAVTGFGWRYERIGVLDSEAPHLIVADLNGDHLPEPIHTRWLAGRTTSPWAFRSNDRGTFGVYNNFHAGISLLSAGPRAPLTVTDATKATRAWQYLAADLDASGRTAFIFPSLRLDDPLGSDDVVDESWYRAAVVSNIISDKSALVNLPRAHYDDNELGTGFRLYFADLNGDGNADAVKIDNYGSSPSVSPSVFINTGTVGAVAGAAGFLPAQPGMTSAEAATITASTRLPNVDAENASGVHVIDYDLDNRSDLIVLSRNQGPMVYHQTADGFKVLDGLLPVAQQYQSVGTIDGGGGRGVAQVLDQNGDGLGDFVDVAVGPTTTETPPPWGADDTTAAPTSVQHPAWYGLRLVRRNSAPIDRIKAIHDGVGDRVGGTKRFHWSPVAQRASGTCSYPQSCVTRGLWTVDSEDLDNGTSDMAGVGYLHFTHSYSEGRSDLLGRGFLGFGQAVVTNSATGATTTREFDNVSRVGNNYTKAGRLSRETTVTTVEGVDYTVRTDFEHPIISGDPSLLRTPFAVGTGSIHTARFAGTDVHEIETTFDYDTFGNVEHKVVHAVGTETVHEETTTTYVNQTSNWLIGLATDVRIDSSSATETLTRVRHADYDLSTGFVASTLAEAGYPTQLTRTFHRNAEGLVVMLESSGSGSTRWSYVDYEPVEGIEPLALTNGLGHVSRSSYHRGLGVVTATEDINGVLTTFQYDGFGRRRGMTAANGLHTETHYLRDAYPLTVTVSANSGESESANLDRLGRVVRRSHRLLEGTTGVIDTTYDPVFPSLPQLVSRPYLLGSTATAFTGYVYDDLGRLTTTANPDGSSIAIDYQFLDRVVTTDEVGRHKSRLLDDVGRTIATGEFRDDGTELLTRYEYRPFSMLKSVTDPLGNVLSYEHDRFGRVTLRRDPDRGMEAFEYNAFGEIVATTDGTGDVETIGRDPLGRSYGFSNGDGTTCIEWDTAPNGKGKIARATSPFDVVVSSVYDVLSRETQRVTAIHGEAFALDRSYDEFGRVKDIAYPTVMGRPRLTMRHAYAINGELSDVGPPGELPYWRAEKENAAGALTEIAFGNGTRTKYTYGSARGFLTGIATTKDGVPGASLVSLRYTLYPDGNVSDIDDTSSLGPGAKDSFEYDGRDQLRHWIADEGEVEYQYDDVGNLTRRLSHSVEGDEDLDLRHDGVDDAGNVVGPHAVTRSPSGGFVYAADGAQVTAPGRSISFTRAGLPRELSTSLGSATFDYDAFSNRAVKRSDTSTTLYVADLFERREDHYGFTHVFHVMATGGEALQITWRSGGPDEFRYLHKDRQSSVRVITDESGNVVERMRFDPYGRRVDPDHPFAAFGPISSSIHAGFTEQEQDDDLALTNMRGRLYDPNLMTFVSADPYVPVALGRGYNRYAYVLNNPLRYRDPSGYEPDVFEAMTTYVSGDPPTGTPDPLHSTGTLTTPEDFAATDHTAGNNALLGTLRTDDNGSDYSSQWFAEGANTLSDPSAVVQAGIATAQAGMIAFKWWNGGYQEEWAKDWLLEHTPITQVDLDAAKAIPFAHMAEVGLAAEAFEVAVTELRATTAEVEAFGVAPVEGVGAAEAGDTYASCTGGACPCFVAGTLVAAGDSEKPIEAVRLGDRVGPDDQRCALTDLSGWREVDLTMTVDDHGRSDVLEIHLLRPNSWLSQHRVSAGAIIDLTLDDLNVRGAATVLAVGGAATSSAGSRCPVTGWIRHVSYDIVELDLADAAPLYLTSHHRMFSADRGDWVAAGSLIDGEALETMSGAPIVSHVRARRLAPREVFNVEVLAAHEYFVGEARVRTHNSYVTIGGKKWRRFEPGAVECRTGCRRIAERIQKAIGGAVRRIAPKELTYVGSVRDSKGQPKNPAGDLAYGWEDHYVVVKGGRVFDGLTGPDGMSIGEYKSLYVEADAIDWSQVDGE